MNQSYSLSENVKIVKQNSPYNVYITSENVYFVSIDKSSPRLKKLKKTYTAINAVGIRFGALGALITMIPLELFVTPRINRERTQALNNLRNIDVNQLDSLDGYGCPRREVVFEEKKKDRYKIHLGDNWLLLSGNDARDLHKALL